MRQLAGAQDGALRTGAFVRTRSSCTSPILTIDCTDARGDNRRPTSASTGNVSSDRILESARRQQDRAAPGRRCRSSRNCPCSATNAKSAPYGIVVADAGLARTRLRIHKPHPNSGGGVYDEGDVVRLVFIEARRDGLEVFGPIEEAFDEASKAIEIRVERRDVNAAGDGHDVGRSAASGQVGAQGVADIALASPGSSCRSESAAQSRTGRAEVADDGALYPSSVAEPSGAALKASIAFRRRDSARRS